MYGNILSLITQFLTPDVVARMAQSAGISDRAVAQKAVGAAVPAILSGLAGIASKPEGARQIADTIARQPADMLGKVTNMAGNTTQLADSGKSMLTSLLGTGALASIAGGIARFAGIDETSMRSLLGMIAPAVLGVLGREAGSDPSGIAKLLTSQKDAFAAAMPAGLSDYLKPEVLGDRGGAAVRPAPAYRDRATTESHRSAATATTHSWLYWAVPLAALAALALYFLGDRDTQQTADAPAAKTERPGQIPGKMAEGDLQGRIASTMAALVQTLQSARDSGSLAAAMPKLQQASGELGQLADLASQMPPETREKLAETIRSRIGHATRSLETVDAMPGVPADARPLLSALRSRIETLASAAEMGQARGAMVAERVVYITELPHDAMAISTYFDRGVQNGAGQKVGTINDLIVAPDGRILAAIVGVGGFLGIGEKEVSVPFAAVRVVRRDNDWYLLMDTTREALADAPPFQPKGERVRLDPRPTGAQK